MVIGPGGWAATLVVALALGIGWGWSTRSWRRATAELERALGVARADRPLRARRRQLNGPLLRVGHLAEAVFQGERGRRLRLAREVEQLRVVLAGMSEAVIAIDARRRILFANGSADRLFGLDGERAVGRLILELIRNPQVEEAVEATLGGGAPGPLTGRAAYRGEISVADRDLRARANPRTFAIHGETLPGDAPAGAVLVFHDVSDLRRLERLRQDFVANASHELKTPLAAIKAYTETLLDSALHDEAVAVRFLHRIDEQADRLHQLIQDLLRLARLEAGQAGFQHSPLAVAASLQGTVANHAARAEAKGLNLSLDLGTIEATTRIVADEEAFAQVFDNLIDNAIKYTHAGSVRIQGRVEGRTVVVVVADSGIGIPRADLHRVFERFYRVDKARSRELGGTGLGLSIVKHVVSSLGGQITVDSRLGVGTEFCVRLPRLDSR